MHERFPLLWRRHGSLCMLILHLKKSPIQISLLFVPHFRRVSDHIITGVMTDPTNEMTGPQMRYEKTKDHVQSSPAVPEEIVYEAMF